MDASNIDAEQFRRAIGTLLNPAGGIVTPGDCAVTQQTVPNMSVQIGVGQAWIPGTTTPTEGPYYSRNGAAVTQAINAANPTNPRIDLVGVQVIDKAYAGAATSCGPFYVAGTPTAGANITPGSGGYLAGAGAVPPSSLLFANVLVPANASSIVTADIQNVAAQTTPWASRGATNIATSQTVTSTTYTTMPTPDQVTVTLPTNGLLMVGYQAAWSSAVGNAGGAAIFVGSNQVGVITSTSATAPALQSATSGSTANVLTPLATVGFGLAGGNQTSNYTGDLTTGQIITMNSGGQASGPCFIFAAAGTYAVSIQFKSTSGSVTAVNRKLWVAVLPFS